MKIGLREREHFSTEQREKMSRFPHAGLVVIGVDPDCQGKGYGSILLQEFERLAVEVYGVRNLQLTVLTENQQAIRAYERNGWIKGKVSGNSLQMWKQLPLIPQIDN